MSVLSHLADFFGFEGRRLLVAFSGGPDSLALLWNLRRTADRSGHEVVAAHLDHGLDDDSRRRARRAEELASTLDVRCVSRRLEAGPGRGESLEAWARARRYEFLEGLADELGADIVTAHHADDQAETVLLRMLYGSGLGGLSGIRERRGRLVRPLLGFRRAALHDSFPRKELEPVSDPTNVLLDVPRNYVRHELLPRLEACHPGIVEQLGALAAAAAAARWQWDQVLADRVDLRSWVEGATAGTGLDRPTAGADLDRRELELLPEPLWSLTLAALGRCAGAPYPAGLQARQELRRQLRDRSKIGCDCGDGWRWEGDRVRLRLVGPGAGEDVPACGGRPPKPKTPKFAYTLDVPGEVEVPELALRVRLRRGELAPWMFRGRVDRAGLSLPSDSGHQVLIRNRRSGDRLQPLGAAGRLRLKDLLIARRIPRKQRDRIPLMIIDGTIAWVPGVTIDERFRLSDGKDVWIAELEPLMDDNAEVVDTATR